MSFGGQRAIAPTRRGPPGLDEYTITQVIGSGSFSTVYQAHRKADACPFALKVFRHSARDHVPTSALRELRFLQTYPHINIVRLDEVIMTSSETDTCGSPHVSGSLALVLEFVEGDLTSFIAERGAEHTPHEIKTICVQLLSAVEHIHHYGYIHRDIKSANILITADLCVKLADFGTARCVPNVKGDIRQVLTPIVTTLWYRSPEMLLESNKYSFSVDIWSVGIVIGEMLSKGRWITGDTEIAMLIAIASKIGPPSSASARCLANFSFSGRLLQANFVKATKDFPLGAHFPDLSEPGVDLLTKMLSWDAERRPTAKDARRHEFFNY